jgi:adenylosuccinate lyase
MSQATPMTTPDQLRAIIAAVERAADRATLTAERILEDGRDGGSMGTRADIDRWNEQATLLKEAATLLRRIGPADGEPK